MLDVLAAFEKLVPRVKYKEWKKKCKDEDLPFKCATTLN